MWKDTEQFFNIISLKISKEDRKFVLKYGGCFFIGAVEC